MTEPNARQAAILDSQYRAGARAGWNAAHADDPDAAIARLLRVEPGAFPKEESVDAADPKMAREGRTRPCKVFGYSSRVCLNGTKSCEEPTHHRAQTEGTDPTMTKKPLVHYSQDAWQFTSCGKPRRGDLLDWNRVKRGVTCPKCRKSLESR